MKGVKIITMIYIFIFGLIVSIDALVCGLSLVNDNEIAKMSLFSLVVSFIGSYIMARFGFLLSQKLDCEIAIVIGGITLIVLSIYSLLETYNIIKLKFDNKKYIACSIVAVDASFAAMSLSVMGYKNYLYIAIVFGVLHGLAVLLGILLSKHHVFQILLNKIEILPAIILFFIGLSKII